MTGLGRERARKTGGRGPSWVRASGAVVAVAALFEVGWLISAVVHRARSAARGGDHQRPVRLRRGRPRGRHCGGAGPARSRHGTPRFVVEMTTRRSSRWRRRPPAPPPRTSRSAQDARNAFFPLSRASLSKRILRRPPRGRHWTKGELHLRRPGCAAFCGTAAGRQLRELCGGRAHWEIGRPHRQQPTPAS